MFCLICKSYIVFSQQDIAYKSNTSRINDSLILIDLNKIYSQKTIKSFILKEEYYLGTEHLVMTFVIKGDSLIFANNDNKTFMLLNLSTLSLTEIGKYPSFIKYPIYKMIIINDSIICSDYYVTCLFDVKSKQCKFIDKMSFGKSNDGSILVKKESDIILKKKFPKISFEDDNLLSGDGFDFIENFYTGKDVFIFTKANEGIILYETSNNRIISKHKINIQNIDLSNFLDVDILYSSKEVIKFILKTYSNEDFNDLLVSYNLNNYQIIKVSPLLSHIKISAFNAQPAIFPAGTSYFYQKGIIYRLKTTIKGICIEKWKVEW